MSALRSYRTQSGRRGRRSSVTHKDANVVHYLAAVNCFASRISARSLSALRVSRARLLK
jgi:hypothetical protein